MNRKIIFLFACMVAAVNAFAQDASFVNANRISTDTVTETGAWCWFADPRALSYVNESGSINSTYIGYIDVHGNIKGTQINRLTNTVNEVLIRSWFQPDDHNNPTFLILPDERIMIFYSRHTDESCFYYRISQLPGDITALGKEMRIETTHHTTYPSPFILSGDPDRIYLCWRGIGWHPTIARLTMPDENGEVRFDRGPYQIMQSQNGRRGVRPYAKYASNGKDKIYLAYTTTHPDNQSVNYIYFNCIDINTCELKDIKGRKLETVGSGTLHHVEATPDYRNSYPDAVVEDAPYRNWLWEISVTDEQKPVIAMVRINENKDSHDYYHVKWTGQEWRKTFLSNAGGHFHQTPDIEKCYSGGMAIDKTDPDIIYGSIPVEGKHGRVYELKKFTVTPEGALASVEQLTFDSPKNNIRPFTIPNQRNSLQMAWMSGDYYDWIVSAVRPGGFPTAICTNMELPAGKIDLKKGLLYQKSSGKTSPEHREKIRVRKSGAFTVCLTLSGAYCGEIVKTGDLAYGLTREEHPKPYIKIKNREYSSSNVLGNSDVWKIQNRGTGGHWYPPAKPETLRLAISYENGWLRTYIDGLIDQSVKADGLSLSDVTLGGFEGTVDGLRIYSRALSQDEIKAVQSEKPD
jgi:hypothetical protein